MFAKTEAKIKFFYEINSSVTTKFKTGTGKTESNDTIPIK